MHNDEKQATWKFNEQSSTELPSNNSESVKWSASEYISNEKSTSWILLLILVATVVSALVYVVSKSVISVIAVAVVFLYLGLYSTKKPRTLNYEISHDGIFIDQRLHKFEDFKGFYLSDPSEASSITLIPAKRFMVPISLYFEPKDERAIVDIVGLYLPMESTKQDFIDRIAKKIRF